ncbi:MAG: ParE family plasmid stabilization system protein [Ramlibacter sp.]|nr:ParE family plasmid stabilization system protein [Ramlibacter sp.]
MKPVFRRAAADQDVEGIIDYHLEKAGANVALKFVDALQAAYARTARQPAAGSPRYAHELGIPGLRTWPLQGFPYRIFYFEYADKVEVWRVLHEQRDIPTHLLEPDS